MELFKAAPRPWGNSLGITLPREVVRNEHLSSQKKITILVIGSKNNAVKKAFGTLKLKKPTQKVMEEIDEGYD